MENVRSLTVSELRKVLENKPDDFEINIRISSAYCNVTETQSFKLTEDYSINHYDNTVDLFVTDR